MLDAPENTEIANALTLGRVVYAELTRRMGAGQAAAFVQALDDATRPGTPERAAQDAAWRKIERWFDAPQSAVSSVRQPRAQAGSVTARLRLIAPGSSAVIVGASAGKVAARAHGLWGAGVANCRTTPEGVRVTRKPLD